MRFGGSIGAPTRIVVGKQYDSEASEVVRVGFELCQVRAHFEAITNLRVPGTFGDYESTKEDQTELQDPKEGLGIELPINKSSDQRVVSDEVVCAAYV